MNMKTHGSGFGQSHYSNSNNKIKNHNMISGAQRKNGQMRMSMPSNYGQKPVKRNEQTIAEKEFMKMFGGSKNELQMIKTLMHTTSSG